MKTKEQDQVFINIIDKLIRLFVKVQGKIIPKLSSWISDLQYYRFMTLFGERDDDIWIATYMKSGTTLTQMILYQLTTDGNMDFKHINHISPWVRNASFRGLPPSQLASPRILKSHDPYHKFDKSTKGRFIFVFRDAADLMVSLYHHRKNYNMPDLKFDDCFETTFVKDGDQNWFTFTKEWLVNKNGFRILYLKYEDILSDFDGTVEKIVDFCDLKVDASILQRVKKRSGFEFMKQHEEKFGVERVEDRRIFDQFIRKGQPGEGKAYLSEDQIKIIKKNFEKNLGRFNETMGLNYHDSEVEKSGKKNNPLWASKVN